MKLNTTIKLFLFATCIFILSGSARSSHIAAVTLTYKHVGSNNFVVTVKLYRDCTVGGGGTLLNYVIINYRSDSCGASGTDTLAATGSVIAGTGNLISLPCLGITTCNPPQTQYSVEEFIYEDTIALPNPNNCSDWVISFDSYQKEVNPSGLYERNKNNVLIDTAKTFIYVSANLNNKDVLTNSSPAYSSKPVAVFCVGKPSFFEYSATDADGDSLIYSFVQAQGDSGRLLPYISPYRPDSAIAVDSKGINLDSKNGIISFTPTQQMTSVFCILIQEYRYISGVPVLVGSVKSDMQVVLLSNCAPDTLYLLGDTTKPTFSHPAITAFCKDTKLDITFSHDVQCNTIAKNGSDFRLWHNSTSENVRIDSAIGVNCILGSTKTITIYVDSLIRNGSYLLKDTTGSDGNPVLGGCGRPLDDTLEIKVDSCIFVSLSMQNVTINNCSNQITIQWSKYVENFDPDRYFDGYFVYRNENGGPFQLIYTTPDSAIGFTDTAYTDNSTSLNVDNYIYGYYVKMLLDSITNFQSPVSDSLYTIKLTATPIPMGPDTLTWPLNLSWTPYIGWKNQIPNYLILESRDKQSWKNVKLTSATNYEYKKPDLAYAYFLMIETRNDSNSFVSRSNCLQFEVLKKPIPSVFTPNGDGVNDYFFINDILRYEYVHLRVYNRWGVKVFEEKNYQNTWDGRGWFNTSLVEGTYYYVVEYSDGTTRNGFVMLLLK